jgi:hypothetical protein
VLRYSKIPVLVTSPKEKEKNPGPLELDYPAIV